jgi:hypothetical protein
MITSDIVECPYYILAKAKFHLAWYAKFHLAWYARFKPYTD